MQVEYDKKNKQLVIRIPVNDPLEPSASRKTLVVASSHGNKVFNDVQFNGQPLTVGVNAYIKPAAAAA
ncbi:MAG: hypothetical protein DWQ19_12785 [Crenarchaeota archaeon]|nr:MAG: hypothetical protein DWQ19_12785 [Thermoproteota archaeon]